MADFVCKYASPLCVIIGDLVFVHAFSFMYVIGDSICYHSAFPMAIASVSQFLHTHIYIQIPSLVTDRLKHYRQKIKHST